MRELAPKTRSSNRFAPCSVIKKFDLMEQNPEAKCLLHNIVFHVKLFVQTKKLCSGNMLLKSVVCASSLTCVQPLVLQYDIFKSSSNVIDLTSGK